MVIRSEFFIFNFNRFLTAPTIKGKADITILIHTGLNTVSIFKRFKTTFSTKNAIEIIVKCKPLKSYLILFIIISSLIFLIYIETINLITNTLFDFILSLYKMYINKQLIKKVLH